MTRSSDPFQMKESPSANRVEIFYTVVGDHEAFDVDQNPILHKDGEKVLAKKVIINTDRIKLMIKIGSHGKIYNPIGLFSEGHSNKFLSKIGRKAWEFKEVNLKVFDMYLSFLRTKNIAWLNNAERELN